MAVSKDDILDTIAGMTVLEVTELVEAMEEKFGVTAAVTAAPVVAAAGEAAAAEEQTEFDVIMPSFGENKVSVIKAVRALTGLGVPATVKEGISKDEAEEVKQKLEEAGATAELK